MMRTKDGSALVSHDLELEGHHDLELEVERCFLCCCMISLLYDYLYS